MTPERWQQIERIFEAALDCAPAKRTSFLDQACGEDSELRREVESLLLADEAAADEKTAGFHHLIRAEALPPEDNDSIIGQTLSHYRIDSLLGAGGMGRVYLAKDTSLKRQVAIKILPPQFMRDPDRVRRFEQEARAASSLNHPNIITIHEIGRVEEARFIVTELIDGQTLRRRMESSRMSLPEALKISTQIAGALAAAHAAGIIHRDIKPENVMVRSDGLVKVLDFGLAKLKPEHASGGMDLEASTKKPLTGPGFVMGTVGYMSPEQVRGQNADHRSDLFSFGVMLYEMLSGQRPFQGESAAEAMAAIVKAEPPELSKLNEKVPAQFERIVRRCLEKEPERRFQSASDLGFALESLSTQSGSQPKTSPEPATGKEMARGRMTRHERLAWGGIVILLLVAIALLAYFRRAPAEIATVRFSIPPPEKATAFDHPAISPDGRHLAFVAAIDGKSMLWVRAIDSIEAKALPGTDDAKFPFWSPDSRQIGFFTQNKLKKAPLSGGSPITICDAQGIASQGTNWGRNGLILFLALEYGLYRVAAEGGSVEKLQFPVGWVGYLALLPDGRHFLYSRTGSHEGSGIYVASIDGQENRRLMDAEYSRTAYSATPEGKGYIFFVREGMLLAHPFDFAERRLTGVPVHLADRVKPGSVTVSENGVLTYQTIGGINKQQLAWFDRSGTLLEKIGSPEIVKVSGGFLVPRLSPDEKRIALARGDSEAANNDIWLLDLVRGAKTRFTDNARPDEDPVWSADGRRIVWSSSRGTEYSSDLYNKPLDSAGQDELLLQDRYWKFASDWSVAGDIIFNQIHPKTRYDLWILPDDKERKPYPYLVTPYIEVHARFSPDAKWISYISDKSGQIELYVQAFPSNGVEYQISNSGVAQATSSRWRRDGKEVLYVAPDGKMMAVEVKTGATFEAGNPRALFDLKGIKGRPDYFNVTRDGQKFLLKISVEEPGQNPATVPFTVVLNWTSLLPKTQ
ncbi:MAG: protein kinase domain-containing protein [Blastocatellia bacterium]